MTAGRETYARIAVLDNVLEAQHLAAVLDERRIAHRLVSYHDTAYDGLFQAQRGWGEVRAPEANRAAVLRVLHDLRAPPAPAVPEGPDRA